MGAINTGLGYFLYFLLVRVWSVPYLFALMLAYAGALLVAFALHRTVVFRVRGPVFRDLWRFVLVNLVALVINVTLLPVAVEVAGLNPLLAQVVVTLITVALTFFGHREISFRRESNPE